MIHLKPQSKQSFVAVFSVSLEAIGAMLVERLQMSNKQI